MINADEMQRTMAQLSDGRWVVARPIPCPFWTWRLRDALEVLMGRAEAVTFTGQ